MRARKSFKQQLGTATVIGAVGGLVDFMATTGWMHRSLTHKAYTLDRPLETAARAVIWGTGTRPRVWATVHRAHHENADAEGDPHSPALQGRYGVLKLFFKNTPLYSQAARAVEKADVFAPDLQPDELDRKLFDNVKLGLKASLGAHILANRVSGNPGYMGTVSWIVEKAVYIFGGNIVNSIGHAGARPFTSLVAGTIEPQPDGTFGADSKVVSLLTLGEGNQRYHHEHPESLFFGENPQAKPLPVRAAKDFGGTAALLLVRLNLASEADVRPEATSADLVSAK
jgi:fatty-acid desaturase